MSISITNFDCKVNQIEVLKQTELCGHQFTVYGTAENPLFLAKEIAECIEHSNITVMLQTIDEEEKVKITPKQSLGDLVNYKEYNFLTEDGLYEVLMQSRKPIAKDFKKGVKEILKTIRKTGGYLATTQEDTPELIMARVLQVLNKRLEIAKQEKIQNYFADSKNIRMFAMLQDGSHTYLAGQAIKLLNKHIGLFLCPIVRYWRLPIRKYCNALRGSYHLVAAYMAAAFLLPKMSNL